MGHQHDKFESFMTFFSRHFVREYVSYPIPLNDHWVQVFPSLTQDSISLAPQSLYNHSRRQHKVSVDVSGSLPLLLVLLGLDFVLKHLRHVNRSSICWSLSELSEFATSSSSEPTRRKALSGFFSALVRDLSSPRWTLMIPEFQWFCSKVRSFLFRDRRCCCYRCCWQNYPWFKNYFEDKTTPQSSSLRRQQRNNNSRSTSPTFE